MSKNKSKKGLVAELFDGDDESLFSEDKDEGFNRVKVFMATTKDETVVRKADTRSGQWVEITMKKEGEGKGRKQFPQIKFFSPRQMSIHLILPLIITFDYESECDNQDPLPPIPKLSRAEPIGTSTDVIPPADLTQTSTVSDKTKQVVDKESSVKVIKKKAQNKSPSVHDPCLAKKADSSTEQLLLTLMEEVKGLKEQIKPPSESFVSFS
nr:hypothetical protein [Tanacetum cinerariifolium]